MVLVMSRQAQNTIHNGCFKVIFQNRARIGAVAQRPKDLRDVNSATLLQISMYNKVEGLIMFYSKYIPETRLGTVAALKQFVAKGF